MNLSPEGTTIRKTRGKGSGRFPSNQKFQNVLTPGVGDGLMVREYPDSEKYKISELRTIQPRIEKIPGRSSGETKISSKYSHFHKIWPLLTFTRLNVLFSENAVKKQKRNLIGSHRSCYFPKISQWQH